jgi:hypothetical protein
MKKILLAICICATLKAAGPLVLADNARTDYSIVMSVDASPSEVRAANELHYFLNEITGARFPVVTDAKRLGGKLILLGKNRYSDRLRPGVPYDKLGAEGFTLRTTGANVVIAGGRERGTMYGVYTFLEKLGCRWVAADSARIPKTRTLKLAPLDEIQTPAFEYRDIYIAEAWDKDWAARNKTNGGLSRLDASTGGKIQYFPFVHSFYAMVPPEKYFKDHPEYFSLVDGQRRGEKAQLCLTNPDVLRIGIESVLRWMKEHPEATISSVSQNDYDGQCECDKCRQVEREEGGSAAGPLLRYVNAVAEAVEKQYPQKLIDTLAYFYSESPPSKTRPRANVRIRMCPIGACNAHPYEKCPHNAYIMKNLKAWSRITNNIYVWHYNANFTHFLLPVPDFDELAADVEMYQRNGVVGLFMQGNGVAVADNGPLRAYVLSRLLWNPKADVSQALNEFHETYYGKAAAPMRAYFDLVQKLVRFAPAGEGQHWWCCRSPLFADARLARAKELFGQALASAEDETIRKHVSLAQLSIRYAEMRREQQFVVRDARYEPRGLEFLRREWPVFVADARRLGATRVGEEADLAQGDVAFRESLRSHPVATLENASLRLQLVPELNARAISIVDKRTGKELLNQPASVETAYPDRSGLSVQIYPDYVGAAPLPVKWTVEPARGARELVLSGAAAHGLKLRRTLRLRGDQAVLETETTVENSGAAPVELAMLAQFDADAGRMEDAAVEFRARDGSTVRRKMIEPAEQPGGAETYSGARLPDGEWRVTNRGAALELACGFRPAEATRAALNWSAKSQNRVSLGVWSPKRTLRPGESLPLAVSYQVR